MDVNLNYTWAQEKIIRWHFLKPNWKMQVVAGLGSGKSFVMIVIAILYRLQLPQKHIVSVSARDLGQFKSGTVPEFHKVLTEFFGFEEGRDYHINKQSCNIEIYGYGIIQAKSAENYNSAFRGPSKSVLMLDENEYYDPEAYKAAVARVRAGPSAFIGFSSPNGFNYIYDLFYGDSFVEVEPHVFVSEKLKRIRIEAPTWSNHNLPDDYIPNLHAMYDKKRFAQECGAERVNLKAGLVYDLFDRSTHVAECFDQYQPGDKLTFSLDYNKAWFHGNFNITKNGITYTLDEIMLEYKDTRAMAEAILDKCAANNWRIDDVVVLGDSAGNNRKDVLSTKTAYEIFREYDLQTEKAYKPHVDRRITVANTILYQNKSVIDPRCKHLIKDLEQVSYNEKGEVEKLKRKELTHASDAWSYYIWSVHKTKEKRKVGQVNY